MTAINDEIVFALTDEQQELRRTLRGFLEARSPESEVRRLMETPEGHDPEVWRAVARDLGLPGLLVPEVHGGAGFGWVELAIVLEEMGRALLCAPYLASALTVSALLASGDEAAQKDYLPAIASGESIGTLALAEQSGRWDEAGISLRAERRGESFSLEGGKHYVLDGCSADLVVAAARSPEGVSLFAVHGDARGLRRELLPTLDLTRRLARLEFSETPARLVGRLGGGWPTLEHTLDLAAVALAAEQVGGAQRCLELSVEYAKSRVQFGRPIGSFQAIKHKCADMLIRVERARSAAQYAAWCAAAAGPDLPVAACVAKAACSETFLHCAGETVQIHGGLGFTWEHPAHLFFKRAASSEILFGDPAQHRAQLARRIDL